MNQQEAFLMQAKLGCQIKFHPKKNNDLFDILQQRKHDQNKEFEFNDENLFQIEKINTLLDSRFKEGYFQAEKIEQFLLHEMEVPFTYISDYEIDFKVHFFAEKNIPILKIYKEIHFSFMNLPLVILN